MKLAILSGYFLSCKDPRLYMIGMENLIFFVIVISGYTFTINLFVPPVQRPLLCPLNAITFLRTIKNASLAHRVAALLWQTFLATASNEVMMVGSQRCVEG